MGWHQDRLKAQRKTQAPVGNTRKPSEVKEPAKKKADEKKESN